MPRLLFTLALTLQASLCLAQQPEIEPTYSVSDFIMTLPQSAPKEYREFRGLLMLEQSSADYYPLILRVFFGPGSPTIPSRYVTFASADETGSFTDDKIAGGTIEHYRQLLNIIGYRLRQHPEIRINLTGSKFWQPIPGESESVSLERVAHVREYLRSVWRIDTSRMRVMPLQSLPEDKAHPLTDSFRIDEGRSVEITVDDPGGSGWELVKPVANIERSFRREPESKQFLLHNGIPDSLVLKRRIEIQHGGRLWNVIRNISPIGTAPQDYDWRDSSGNRDESDADYTLRLIVTDRNGIERTSNELNVPVLLLKLPNTEENNVRSHLVRHINLVQFNYDSPEPGALNERILHELIYPLITDSTKVWITGWTDIIGAYDMNLKLSQQRAEEIGKRIAQNVKARYDLVDVRGIGETYPLYDNELPEGRFYNRTVQVTIDVVVPEWMRR